MGRASAGVLAAAAALLVLAWPTAAVAAPAGHHSPRPAKMHARKAAPTAAATPLPVFDCAAQDGNGTTEFFFSYTLPGSDVVTVQAGPDNHVDPGGNVGQPDTFDPGTHNAFSVATRSSTVRWDLAGHTAEGSAANLCTTPPIVAETGSWLVLPAVTAGPLLVWFGCQLRRQRREPVAPVADRENC